MVDWTKIDLSNCCIDGIYNNYTGMEFFNEVKDGVVQHPEKGLYSKVGATALEEMRKHFPQANEAWAYLNFLLKTSVCYVEYLDMHGRKNKMCLCANINILKACSKFVSNIGKLEFALSDPSSLHKFTAVDVNGKVNYELRGIKVNKKLYTSLKLPIFLKGTSIHIAPIFLLTNILKEVLKQDGIIRYKYAKDNGDIRTLDTTFDRTILTKHYTSEHSDEMLNATSVDLYTLFNKGYIRVVELGASKFDSGVRALNIAKILSYKQIQDSEVDYRFLDVDFGGIQDTFHYYMERIADAKVLLKYAKEFVPELESDNKAYIQQELFAKVDTNITYGSTQYLRFLYLYMLDHPEIFREAVKSVFNIDMGISSADTADTVDAHDLGISDSGSSDFGADLGTSGGNDWNSITASASASANQPIDWGNVNLDGIELDLESDYSTMDISDFGMEVESELEDTGVVESTETAQTDNSDSDVFDMNFKFE